MGVSRGFGATYYGLPDWIAIRAEGGSRTDHERVARQLAGFPSREPTAAPDITIRFRAGSPVSVLLREVVCPTGTRRVPLLAALLRLTALMRGYVPLHASAFLYRGTGVVVAGGPHGGKTSALLAFAGDGTAAVADDLVLLDPARGGMGGPSAPLELAPWQAAQLPHLAVPLRFMARILSVLRADRPALRVPPGVLFEPVSGNGRPCALFVSSSGPAADVAARPIDPEDAAERLCRLVRLDVLPLQRHWLAERAGRERDANLDAADVALAGVPSLLAQVLRDIACHELRHPRPVSLAALRRAMMPFIAPSALARAGDPRGRGRVPAAYGLQP